MTREKAGEPAAPAAPADTVPVTLDRRDEIAEGTFEFQFGLGSTLFQYRAGQAIDLHFPSAPTPDPRGHVRPFSLASAPGASRLSIATRIRESPFKRDLLEAPLGTTLHASPPWGDFVLPEGEPDVILMGGGIGVTPFRAMIQDAVARTSKVELSLLHSARKPEEAPFYDEFRRWAATHPHLAYVPIMTRAGESAVPYLGERRRLDAALLDEILDDHRHEALYLIAGPPRFVQGMVGALSQLGIPADRLRTDEFDGY
jgi:ferredoxin-NADP reductase